MSQGNHPFENLSSNHIPQTILSSNVRPSTSSQTQQPPSHQQSPTPRSFAPIAPDPVGLQRMQAVRQNQEVEEHQQPKRRRLTQSSMDAPQPPPLKDEDKLLLQLKDEQQLPWKNIVGSFQQETGKVHAIAALQMRYKRLKDRLQVWTDPDIEALKQAHDYWESRKFDIISAKVSSATMLVTLGGGGEQWGLLRASAPKRSSRSCTHMASSPCHARGVVRSFSNCYVTDARVRCDGKILRARLPTQVARTTSHSGVSSPPSTDHARRW